MFVLEKTRKHLTIIGVRPVPEQNFPPFLRSSRNVLNRIHNLFLISSFVTCNISILCFIMFEATTFTQFSEAGMYYFISCLHISFYTVSIWKRSKILCFIDDIEEIIRRSENIQWKWHSSSDIISFSWHISSIGSENPRIRIIYDQANKTSDTFSNFVWNSMFLSIEVFIFPGCFASFYEYFVLDQSDEAFRLLMPTA